MIIISSHDVRDHKHHKFSQMRVWQFGTNNSLVSWRSGYQDRLTFAARCGCTCSRSENYRNCASDFFLPKQLTAFRNTAKNALTCCFFPINKTFCFKHIICELNLIRISAEHLKRSLCSTDNVHCAHWPFPNLFCLPLLYRVSHLTDPGQKVPKGFLISTELRVPLTVSVFNTFREVIQKNKRPL